MSTESYFIAVSYQFSDTENRGLHSHAVEPNCDLGTIGFAFNMDRCFFCELATTLCLSNNLFVLLSRWDQLVIGEFDFCVDVMHNAATIHHTQHLVWTQLNPLDLLFETSLALAVLRERCNACAGDVLGGSDDNFLVGRFLLALNPTCDLVDCLQCIDLAVRWAFVS